MKILTKISEIRELTHATRVAGKTLGVMGSSGNMHNGHLSLVRRSVNENDLAIMFWMGGTYDRDWDRDRELCEGTGIEYAYLPAQGDFYKRAPLTFTLLPKLSIECPRMEDPAHLDQVTSATAKLYNIFGKMRYYSGEKDWQQLAMFKRMAEDLSTEVEVVGCETVREPDGLALSSRNARLTAENRRNAPALYAALSEAKAAIEAGQRSSSTVEKLMRDRMEKAGTVIYINCVDAETLQPMETLKGDIRLIASLKVGEVPLVDNLGAQVN